MSGKIFNDLIKTILPYGPHPRACTPDPGHEFHDFDGELHEHHNHAFSNMYGKRKRFKTFAIYGNIGPALGLDYRHRGPEFQYFG